MFRSARTLFAVAALGATLATGAAAQTVLDFPTWQAEEPGVSTWWKDLIAAYEKKYPDVKVNIQQVPFKQFVKQMTVRFAAGSPPDIVHLPSRDFASFADQGWLEPLDDRLKSTDILQTWTPLESEMKWGGKTQGVLLMGYGGMLFYNEAKLKEAKLDVPKTPDQWLAAMKATTDANKGNFGLATITAEHPNMVVEMASWVIGSGADSCQAVAQLHRSRRGESRGWVAAIRRLRAEGHELGDRAPAVHRRQGRVLARWPVGVGRGREGASGRQAELEDHGPAVSGDAGRREQQPAPRGEDRREEERGRAEFHPAGRVAGMANRYALTGQLARAGRCFHRRRPAEEPQLKVINDETPRRRTVPAQPCARIQRLATAVTKSAMKRSRRASRRTGCWRSCRRNLRRRCH
jgi:hypothetical protein